MVRESGQAMSEVLSDAIRGLQWSRLLQKTNDAYARLREVPDSMSAVETRIRALLRLE
jgi:hypothetical protein